MSMKTLIFVASLIAAGGCGVQQQVRLVHPQTKATAHCNAHGAGFTGRIIAASSLDSCIKDYEAKGYVRQDEEGS